MRAIESFEAEGREMVKTQSNPRKHCENSNCTIEKKIETFDPVSCIGSPFYGSVVVVVQMKRSDINDYSNRYIKHDEYETLVTNNGSLERDIGCLPRMWPCCLKTWDSSVVQDRGLK